MTTALNEIIGYDKGVEIVKEAASSGRTVREVAIEQGVDEKVFDDAIDFEAIAKPHG